MSQQQAAVEMDFRALFEALPTPYVVLTPDLVIAEANAKYVQAVGRSREQLLGQRLFEVFPPVPEVLDDEGRSPAQALLERVRGTGRSESLPAFRHDVTDSTTGEMVERHWMLVVAPVLDGDGRTVLLVQRVEDLTDFVKLRERSELADRRGERWRRRFQQVEADLFTQAQQLAAALAEREAAAAQAAALSEVALALTAAEDVEDVERVVVGRGLRALGADGGAVITAAHDGSWRLTVNAALGEHVQQTYGHVPYDSPLPALWTARTQQRLLLPTRAAGLAFDPVMAQVYADTQRDGWAFLPLRVGAHRLGALAVAWTHEHELGPAELDLLDGFAAQCAQALLRIHTSEHERSSAQHVRRLAEDLQQALLTPPPEPDHLHVVVRYRAAADAQVGGDWYDAFMQPDGATMLVVGDVVGHDSAAAARMGQLRGLLRALAYDADGTGHDTPAAVLTRVEHAARGLAVDTLATAILARIERIPDRPVTGRRTLRWSNAGHLPPVLLHPDGTSQLLETAADLMLGIDPSTDRHDSTVELPVGATLLLFTDGLVEHRGESLDTGMAALQDALTDLGGTPLDTLCDTLLHRLSPQHAEDDIALVAVRGYPEDRPRPPEAGPRHTPANQPDS